MSKKEMFKQAIHFIDNWLDFQVYFKELPGIAVGIFVEDEIIFQKEYGYANLEDKTKLNNQHLFRIASHSKLFTASAIMKLYHEEKLSIDDKISKHLPWFSSEKDENLQQVRIRHLLTHTSGMTRDGKTGHWSTLEFPGIEEIKSQTFEGISFFETSELFKYSNFGYTVLGQVIEAVSGQSYADYIQKEILDPLEMKNTVVDIDETNLPRHATGHRIKFPREERETVKHTPANIMHAATGLSSNVEDLIKFFKAHIMGNDILFHDYIKREMHRVQFKGDKVDRGLAFGIEQIKGDKIIPTRVVGHSGGYPGFITRSWLNQEDKTIIVVLTNAGDGPASTIALGIIGILAHLKKEKDKFKITKDKPNPDYKDIIGYYQGTMGHVSLFSQIGSKLVVIGPSDVNPVEFMVTYKHKEGNKFINPKEFGFSSPGQVVEFIDGPEGEKVFVDSHGGKHTRYTFSY